MTVRADDDQLVWVDLEMTGLEVEKHTIVEIACIVTDSNLELLDEGIDIVIHADADALANMDDFVRKMHTKSGLLPAISASTVSVADAQARTLEYLRQYVPTAGTAPLCGNSIGTDRRFLDRYMNELDTYLHYRSVDVSSLKELCRRWYPDDLSEAAGEVGATPRARRHPRVDRRAPVLSGRAAHSRPRGPRRSFGVAPTPPTPPTPPT